MTEHSSIRVWVSQNNSDVKAALPTLAKKAIEAVEVGTEVISRNLEAFIVSFQGIIDTVPESKSQFYIDEVELNLAVNAKGGIELVGKIEGGAQASLKIKLRRRSS